MYSCIVFKLTNVLSSGAVGALEERVASLEAAKGPTKVDNIRARGNVHCSCATLETLLYEVSNKKCEGFTQTFFRPIQEKTGPVFLIDKVSYF